MDRPIVLFKSFVRLGIVAAAITSSNPINASTLTWALPTITLEDGQIATGTFTVDQQLHTLADWNVTVSGGSNPTLTNLDFKPTTGCVVFCGEIIPTSIPAPSSIDFRTPLAANNTFSELTLYFNASLSQFFNPSVTQIGVNSSGTLDYEELINPTTVDGLQQLFVTNTGSAEVVLTPEPAFFLPFGLALIFFAAVNRRSRYHPAARFSQIG